jgi:hypothetical protein
LLIQQLWVLILEVIFSWCWVLFAVILLVNFHLLWVLVQRYSPVFLLNDNWLIVKWFIQDSFPCRFSNRIFLNQLIFLNLLIFVVFLLRIVIRFFVYWMNELLKWKISCAFFFGWLGFHLLFRSGKIDSEDIYLLG